MGDTIRGFKSDGFELVSNTNVGIRFPSDPATVYAAAFRYVDDPNHTATAISHETGPHTMCFHIYCPGKYKAPQFVGMGEGVLLAPDTSAYGMRRGPVLNIGKFREAWDYDDWTIYGRRVDPRTPSRKWFATDCESVWMAEFSKSGRADVWTPKKVCMKKRPPVGSTGATCCRRCPWRRWRGGVAPLPGGGK